MLKKKTFGLVGFSAFFVIVLMLSYQSFEQGFSATEKTKWLQHKENGPKQDGPDQAAQYWASLTRAEKGANSEMLKTEIWSGLKQQSLKRSASKAVSGLPAIEFENIGSGNFGGRVRALVVHPDDPEKAVVGAVAGGFWKTTDGGQHWRAINDFLPTLAISSMVIDPDNPERLFAGTGEGFFNADSQLGAGVFVSEDFGESWSQLDSTKNENFYFVNRIAKLKNSNIVLAATRAGIFRSTNLGQSWTEVSGFETFGRGFVDLKADPANAQNVLAVHYGNNTGVEPVLRVESPASIAGDYVAAPASFGPVITADDVGGNLIKVDDGVGVGNDGCEAITQDLTDAIALIQRGKCNFTVKVKNAQVAGALAVVMYNNVDGDPINMGGDDDTVTIPSLMVSKADGESISSVAGSGNVSVAITVGDERANFVMRSTNQGASWTKLGNGSGIPADNVARMELGFGTDSTVYIAAANSDDETRGLYKSTDAGQTFTKTATNTRFIERQGWYDLAIAVDPSDSDKVFAGAVEMYRSSNAGQTMVKSSDQGPSAGNVSNYAHADHHVYTFGPDGSLWIGTDGGIFRSFDGGVSWKNLNNGLNISQPYSIAVSPDGENSRSGGYVSAGNQDNGTQIYFGDNSTWLPWAEADGMFTVWNQQDDQFVYGEIQNGGVFGAGDGGLSTTAMPLPDDADPDFIMPLTNDPNNGERLLASAGDLYLMTDAKQLNNGTWNPLLGEQVFASAMSFSHHNSNVIYYGTGSGDLAKVMVNGVSGTKEDLNSSLITGPVTRIFDSIYDENILYVTLGGYGNSRILHSTDGGSSWSTIQNSLPHIPIFALTEDPVEPNRLWVGTELGVWTGTLSGNVINWQHVDYGPAYTRIIDIIWSDDDMVYIGTHGRGVFKGVRSANSVSITPGLIETALDCDADQALDLGETASLPITIKNTSGVDINNLKVTMDALPVDQSGSQVQVVQVVGSAVSVKQLKAGESQVVYFRMAFVPGASVQSTPVQDMHIKVSSSGNQLADFHHEIVLQAKHLTETGTYTNGAENGEDEMLTEERLGQNPWSHNTTRVNTGSQAWYVADVDHFSDSTLSTPWLSVQPGDLDIRFALNYFTESDESQYWDGAVLELRTQSNPDKWVDIGQHSSVPYDGPLYTNNTARGRDAWSGAHSEWRNALVELGSQYAGETVQIRWRMINDTGSASVGFWVDDIEVTNVQWEQEAEEDNIACSKGYQPLRGMGYSPEHNGHGFEVQQWGEDYFFYLYSYDDEGNPEWYLGVANLENGVLSVPEGGLSRYTFDFDTKQASPVAGNNSIRLDYNVTAATPVCAGEDRTGAVQLAQFDWSIDGEQGSWCTEYIPFEETKPTPTYSGSWYADNDLGWGMTINTQGDIVLVVLYFYDANGDGRWVIGNTTFVEGQEVTLNMSQVQGYGRSATPIDGTILDAGTLILKLSQPTQGFNSENTVTVDVNYTGVNGSTWEKQNAVLRLVSDPIQ